jgi:hypothetical protein
VQNKMTHLRNHLFETLEMLKDPENPMDLERAKVISEVAQTLINSAKVEVDFIKATEQTEVGSEFFEVQPVQIQYQPKRIRGL